MFVSITNFNKPTTIPNRGPILNHPKSVVHSKRTTFEFISAGKFVSKKLVFSRSPNTMAHVFRGSSREEEEIGALEQEVFIDGPSGSVPDYEAGGLESTLNHLSKYFILGLLCIVILWRHDAKALWIVLGANLNIGLSIALKLLLNQERPFSTMRSDPGMPSSHAQSIFFNVFAANLTMMDFPGINGFTITLAGILFALGSYFSWLRVSQRFHTISQVAVGAAVGSIYSVLWFWWWDAFVMKAFISHLWVQLVVAFGAAGVSLAFLLYLIGYWAADEK